MIKNDEVAKKSTLVDYRTFFFFGEGGGGGALFFFVITIFPFSVGSS